MQQTLRAGSESQLPTPPGVRVSAVLSMASSRTALWQPTIDGVQTRLSACSEVNGEWGKFISRRMQEDLALPQRLATCQRPDQIWQTLADFTQRLIHDYQSEFFELTRLGTSLVEQHTDRQAEPPPGPGDRPVSSIATMY